MSIDQLSIRPIQITDAALVLDWENNLPEWNKGNTDIPYSLPDILNLIYDLQDVHRAGQGRWMICLPGSPQPVGVVDLTDIHFDRGESSVGVLVADPAWRRKGIASQALLLLEEKAAELGIRRLLSAVFSRNKPSIALFEQLGYQKIGLADETYFVEGTYIKPLLFEKWLNA